MGYYLLLLLSDVAHRKDRALMRGGWGYNDRRFMLQHWEQYSYSYNRSSDED